MIHVRLYGGLAQTGEPSREGFSVAARPGLTVSMLLREEGVPADVVRVVIVNGQKAALETLLQEGDRVALFPAVGGG